MNKDLNPTDSLPLKPCPFCGNKDVIIAQPAFPVPTQEWYVECSDAPSAECGVMFFYVGTKAETIEAWNKRYVDQKTSDGYHTFEELYEHRYLLFIAFCLLRCGASWIGEDNHYDGYFCLYTGTPFGQISYHIPNKYLYLVSEKIDFKPNNYDGHSSQDVIDRLIKYCDRVF